MLYINMHSGWNKLLFGFGIVSDLKKKLQPVSLLSLSSYYIVKTALLTVNNIVINLVNQWVMI